MHFELLSWTTQPPELHAAILGDDLFSHAHADLSALGRAERRLFLEQLDLLLSTWGLDPSLPLTWTLSAPSTQHPHTLSSPTLTTTPWEQLSHTQQRRLHDLIHALSQDLHALLIL